MWTTVAQAITQQCEHHYHSIAQVCPLRSRSWEGYSTIDNTRKLRSYLFVSLDWSVHWTGIPHPSDQRDPGHVKVNGSMYTAKKTLSTQSCDHRICGDDSRGIFFILKITMKMSCSSHSLHSSSGKVRHYNLWRPPSGSVPRSVQRCDNNRQSVIGWFTWTNTDSAWQKLGNPSNRSRAYLCVHLVKCVQQKRGCLVRHCQISIHGLAEDMLFWSALKRAKRPWIFWRNPVRICGLYRRDCGITMRNWVDGINHS